MLTLLFSSLAVAAEPAYVTTTLRYGVAVPMSEVGIAHNTTIELGAVYPTRHSVGIRFMVIPDPPEVYDERTPNIGFGPALSWAWYGRFARNVDLYPTASLGFAIGISPTGLPVNKILPLLQGGFGIRFHVPAGPLEWCVTPEIGVSPLILAPYFGIGMGLMFPATQH